MLDDLEKLLACDSPLARQTRSLLKALIAGIEEGSSQLTVEDPAEVHARKIVDTLQRLLEADRVRDLPNLPRLDLPSPPSSIELLVVAPGDPQTLARFDELAREMFLCPSVEEELGSMPAPTYDDPACWRTIQHSLLRLSATNRKSWRERWSSFVATSQHPRTEKIDQISFDHEELIYPPFGQSSGLKCSPQAPLHPRLSGIAELRREDSLTQVVSTLLWFIDHEPALRHVYRPLYSFGFSAVDERFTMELVERLRRVALAQKEGDSVKQLRTRIDLDEAIHSLTFDPPPSNDSWWQTFQQRSREGLFELRQTLVDAGQSVHLQVLTDRYAEIRNYTRDDLGVDRGGKPGDVVCCLRVFAKIDQQVYPGRVLYRRL